MPAPRRPKRHLLRFSLGAPCAVIVGIPVITALGAGRIDAVVATVGMGSVAWLAALHRAPDIVAAMPLGAAVYVALFILPLHRLVGGNYTRITARHMVELTETLAARGAPPVLAGPLPTRYRPVHGGSS